MPIEVGLWKLGEKPLPVSFESIESENRLEELLARDLSIADPNLLLIGRQVATASGKFIDLLAMDADGNLVVLELKKNRTPRDVVAQLLDYGWWVRTLEDDDVIELYEQLAERYPQLASGEKLYDAFATKFAGADFPEKLNERHELVLVAGELDDSSERIINYLVEEYGVSINAVFFRFFRDGDSEYLSRAWLVDPGEIEAKVEQKRAKGEWNGEFYVSFGHGQARDWEDARKFGFISAGGGEWYSRTLAMLEPGARVWVNIPGEGYVGVGEVTGHAAPIDDAVVTAPDGGEVRMQSLELRGRHHRDVAENDPSRTEHVVPIRWIRTVPREDAVREKGFFGNQNSAAKPRAKRWQHTVDRLKQLFGVSD